MYLRCMLLLTFISLLWAEVAEPQQLLDRAAVRSQVCVLIGLTGLDVFKEAGAKTFAACVFEHVVTVTDNELTISFGGKGIMINGIEMEAKK